MATARRRLDRAQAGLAAAGVAGAQYATWRVWWSIGSGVPLLVCDALYAGLFALGVRAATMRLRRIAAERTVPIEVAVAAIVLFGAGTWSLLRALQTSTKDYHRPWLDVQRCGSPLRPLNPDCGPVPGTGTVMLLAAIAVLAGGYATAVLATRRRRGPAVTLPRRAAMVALAAGLGGVGWCVRYLPHSMPTNADGRSATSEQGAVDPAATALGELADQVHRVVPVLVVATFLILVPLLRRRDGSATTDRIPLGAAATALAGLAVAAIPVTTIWLGMFADALTGP